MTNASSAADKTIDVAVLVTTVSSQSAPGSGVLCEHA